MRNRLNRNGFESLIVLALVGIGSVILACCSIGTTPQRKIALQPTSTPEMLIVRPTRANPTPIIPDIVYTLTAKANVPAYHPTAVNTPKAPMDFRPTFTPAPVLGNASSSGACTIKGNVNSKGERIYHCPGWRDYYNTDVVPSNGDRWFCSEAEAQAAGFRRPKNIGRYEHCRP